MAMAVIQATTLKAKVLVCSPIKSLRLTRSRMKMVTIGEPDSVTDLRIDENLPERHVGNQDNPGAHHDQNGVEPVERRSFTEFVVNARFKADALANNVGGGERKNSGGKERSIEKTKGKHESRPFPASGIRALAASTASVMLVKPFLFRVAAVQTMMKKTIIMQLMLPTERRGAPGDIGVG